MALIIGDINASQGMSKAIYDQIRNVMEPVDGVEDPDMEDLRESWRKLAYAIATGVVEHLLSNLEVRDVQAQGSVTLNINGDTATTDGHRHGVNINSTANNVTFTQSNDGSGLVA